MNTWSRLHWKTGTTPGRQSQAIELPPARDQRKTKEVPVSPSTAVFPTRNEQGRPRAATTAQFPRSSTQIPTPTRRVRIIHFRLMLGAALIDSSMPSVGSIL